MPNIRITHRKGYRQAVEDCVKLFVENETAAEQSCRVGACIRRWSHGQLDVKPSTLLKQRF